MPGENNLAILLRQMRPILHPEPYAFCFLDRSDFATLPTSLLAVALGLFRETEGITIILPSAEAERARLTFTGHWAHLTLSIHSDLHAIGFLAALTAQLADAQISVNAISAVFHDHLFVPFEQRDHALAILTNLTVAPPEPLDA